ncbi:hypothetical protein [Streptomyces sp. NPDC088812]|uniref:hypothetical protein n=1 Tax=Streptomyces sp. NPDC088812 TaxID=3365905 RepID=UPI0037F6ED9D
MNTTSALFSNGDLDDSLRHQLGKIANAVMGWNEDRLLATPDRDVIEELLEEFRIEAPAIDRDGITLERSEDRLIAEHQFGEHVRVTQRVVTISVPFTGLRDVFSLRPNQFNFNPPRGEVLNNELRIHWTGPTGQTPQQVRQGLDLQITDIERWLGWAAVQIRAYNGQAEQQATKEVQARKASLLANRNLEGSLGFPVRKRADAATYAIPVARKKIIPVRTAPPSSPFKPEPALAEAQYEEALRILRNSRNQLERSPSAAARLGEEFIRDLLLVNLNSHFEGEAAGEVFNNTGKTDILIRSGDRHVFIGECKIWRGPKTITTTLDQLLGYLTWRDTKAALLLFIRTGQVSDILPKAVAKFREHPNYKRDGEHAEEERYDFVFHTSGDTAREIKLAFLPFVLPT